MRPIDQHFPTSCFTRQTTGVPHAKFDRCQFDEVDRDLLETLPEAFITRRVCRRCRFERRHFAVAAVSVKLEATARCCAVMDECHIPKHLSVTTKYNVPKQTRSNFCFVQSSRTFFYICICFTIFILIFL